MNDLQYQLDDGDPGQDDDYSAVVARPLPYVVSSTVEAPSGVLGSADAGNQVRADEVREPLQIRALGPIELIIEGRTIPISSAKQRTLLAMLVLYRSTVVPTDVLVNGLWADEPPPSANATLRTLIARLRRALSAALGDMDAVPLRGTGAGYLLELGSQQLDTKEFERLASDGHRALSQGHLQEAHTALQDALDLWRGPAFGELTSMDSAAIEANRLEEARLAAIEDLADCKLALERPTEALSLLDAHVSNHPLRERAWGQLMLVLYRLGRQADALSAYQRLRRLLDDELGIDPSPDLRQLEQAILQQRAELRPRTTDTDPLPKPATPHGLGLRSPEALTGLSPPAPTPHRDNLPVALTSFVGRADELNRIREAMDSSRLLTLAGAGGAGKTRLALQFSAEVVERFADGVWLAELGSLRDRELVVPTVAGALGLLAHDVAEGDEQDDALAERIRDRQILLILDNCEHLVETTARLVHALLVRCPRVTILATSREILGVPGEVVFRVPPLSLPPDSNEFDDLTRSDAVTLFCQRAQLVDRGFGITPSNAGAIAKICRHLDGMPLALELAAARVPILGAHQIAERLDHRLQLLGVGSRTANPRHQTLRAAIDWSYDLLPIGEQIALRHLSVFPGDFDLDAAEAMVSPVAGASNLTGNGFEVMDLLSRLLDKSLILTTGDESGVRYRLLETIREYAAERLRFGNETYDARRRHRDFFLKVAEDWQRRVVELWTQEAWIAKADIEVHNFRAALEWSLEQGDDEAILRIVGPLGHYWMLSGDIEACGWLERAVATEDSDLVTPQVLARMSLSFMLRDVGSDQGGRSEALLQEAVTLAGDDHHVAGHARYHLADWLVGTGRPEAADLAVRQALAGYEKVQSLSGQGFAYWYLSWPALSRGHVGEARVLLDRSLGLARQAGDDYLALHALSTRGLVLALSGEPDQAEREADDAISAARRSPARQVLVGALTRAAETALLSERSARAYEVLTELLHVLRALGTRRWLAGALEMTAVAVAQNQPRTACILFGSAQAVHRLLGEPPVQVGVLASAARDSLGSIIHALGPRLQPVMDQGAMLSSDEAIAKALDALSTAAQATPLSH